MKEGWEQHEIDSLCLKAWIGMLERFKDAVDDSRKIQFERALSMFELDNEQPL